MLNPFPDLLFIGDFLAPTVIRVALGLLFMWMAYQHIFKKREEIESALRVRPFVIPFMTFAIQPFINWFVWILGVGELLIGAAFILGYYTQIAALLSIVMLIKMLVFRRYLKEIAYYSPAMYFILIAICISLLLSGAGAFAFDIPV